MISRSLYEKMLLKHGEYGSWAVWEAQGVRPKSNMGSQNVFNFETNPKLLDSLRNDVVMDGLNFSRDISESPPFANFHDERPYANDFKIRYAFAGTEYYGAYMTDVLKNLVILDAHSVQRHIKRNPNVVKSNMEAFAEELQDLEAERPMLLAFGRDAHGLLLNHLDPNLYSRLIPLTHYSHQIGKEKYAAQVHSQIAAALVHC